MTHHLVSLFMFYLGEGGWGFFGLFLDFIYFRIFLFDLNRVCD